MRAEEWFKGALELGDDWIVTEVQFEDDPLRVEAHVVYDGEYVCPVCGCKCSRYDTRRRIWRDIDFGSAHADVYAEFPRVRCPSHGVREVQVSWAGNVTRLTRRFEKRCIEYAIAMPLSLAEQLLGVSDDLIRRVVEHESDTLMQDSDFSDVRRLCIDETKSKKGQKYITVVSNADTGRVIFATLGKDSTTMCELRTWLIFHNCDPDGIVEICSDMGEAYKRGCRVYFPKAVQVFDKYHIVQDANLMISAVRRGIGIKGRDGRTIRFKLQKNAEDLDEDEERILDAVLDEYSDIGVAYLVKEAIRDFYKTRDPDHAPSMLRNVISVAMNSGIKAVETFGKTLDEHFDGIVAWHVHNINNGLAEGINSSIQAMKSMARGYGNPEHMISLVYLRSAYKTKFDRLPEGSDFA